MRRFHRLRAGEQPTFLDMLMPSRLGFPDRDKICNTSVASLITLPFSNTALNSVRPLILRVAGKVKRGSWVGSGSIKEAVTR